MGWNLIGTAIVPINSIMPFTGATVKVNYQAGGTPTPRSPEVFETGAVKFDLTPRFSETIVPGSINFSTGGRRYFDRLGSLYNGLDVNTGAATLAGSINYQTGEVALSDWVPGQPNTIALNSLLTTSGDQVISLAAFRIPVAPVRSGSVQILATRQTGGTINATADSNGIISAEGIWGVVDYQSGIVSIEFGVWVVAADHTQDVWYDAANIVDDYIWMPQFAFAETIKYNAVAYTYLPLDADLLGLDPVRLPQDGRVPIFRTGGFAVLGNTGRITATVTNAMVINCARVRLSRVRVVGADGVVINAGYSADLEAGLVTFEDVSGMVQPVTVEHRIEDMMQVSDVQINGQLAFTRRITHDYPVSGSYMSSALITGDLKARVSIFFDQTTWSNVWADALTGNPATATFNSILYPFVVTNKGAMTERWAIVFTNTTSFNVIGENVGVIGTGNTSEDCSPINPATGSPYFSIPALGWGMGWSAGNVQRFNTVGALFPVWLARTIQQGPETVTEDSFSVLIRGDVDRP